MSEDPLGLTKIRTDKEESNIINEISNIMIAVPKSKLHDFDLVLCNKNYNNITHVKEYEGIGCSNYRAISYKGTIYYLRVSTIDLDNPNKPEINYNNFINEKCEENDIIKEFKKRELLDNDKIIYFKGAYTAYPSEWEGKNKDIKYLGKDKVEIYRHAARAIFYYIIPYLKKIGIKTILVDPEPGYHPCTTEKCEEDKRNGLIKLYKEMGLKEIKCLYRIGGYISLETWGREIITENDILGQSNNMEGKKEILVMIGSVEDITSKLLDMKEETSSFLGKTAEWGLSIFGKVSSTAKKMAQQIKETREFFESNVPFKSYDSSSNIFIQGQPRSIFTNDEAEQIKKTYTDLIYKNKYLKYKQKYLKLKKLN